MDSPPDRLVAATPELVARLSPTLSDDHRREVAAVCDVSPGFALSQSLACSVEAYALTDAAGEPLFAMGVEAASPVTGGAMVWMLADGRVGGRARSLLRAARWGVARAFAATGAEWLEQYIPAWYGTGLRFAARVGFSPAPGGGCDRAGNPLCRVVCHREKGATRWERF